MREIRLDFAGLAAPEAVQEYLQEAFGFPEYYGKNLDALYDELTAVMEETRIGFAEAADGHLCGEKAGVEADRAADRGSGAGAGKADGCGAAGEADALQGYLRKVRRVIRDAAEENKNLHL